MNEETIKENAQLCQKKIKVCGQLFAKTYQASRGYILSRKDTTVIKDKIGKIKESIQEELNYYQSFYPYFLLGTPFQIDINKLNLIKQKQALLIGSLNTILNQPEISDTYKKGMFNLIQTKLENDTLTSDDTPKKGKH